MEKLDGFYLEIGFEVYEVLYIDIKKKKYCYKEQKDISKICDCFSMVPQEIMEILLKGLQENQYKEEEF